MGVELWRATATVICTKTIPLIVDTSLDTVKSKYFAQLICLLAKVLSVTDDSQVLDLVPVSLLSAKLVDLKKLSSDLRTASNKLHGTLVHRFKENKADANRETDVQADTQTHKQTDKQTHKQTHKQKHRQTDKKSDRQKDRQSKQTDNVTNTGSEYCAPAAKRQKLVDCNN